MKKIVLAFVLALCLGLCACAGALPGMLVAPGQGASSTAPPQGQSVPLAVPGQAPAIQSQSAPGGLAVPGQGSGAETPGSSAAPQSAPPLLPDVTSPNYSYGAEVLALVNGVLNAYATGALPEPMRYNTDTSGIHNAPPPGTALPQAVSSAEVEYELQSGGTGPNSLVARLALGNDYVMDVHVELDNSGEGRPTRATGVTFYDMQGLREADFALAPRGGDFLYLKSDRLYASADFEELRTDGGIVSGSLSWNRANNFLWIDIDSMREPFFYTYFVVDGALQQDYPQKEWQRLTVIKDDRMLAIAQSLYEQFRDVLETAWLGENA